VIFLLTTVVANVNHPCD